ncbi:MAG: bifunctional diguanylate cyclase/phosphodiesterase, partial [Desulfovibrio sp.]|nr:bifunctional diguanylate cyclase/phosphodiesterase [Desulfovibrio sp.]
FINGSDDQYTEDWFNEEKSIFLRLVEQVKKEKRESQVGYINVQGEALLVAIHKIYDVEKKNPSNGFLVMSTALDKRFIDSTANITHLDISILPIAVYSTISSLASNTLNDDCKILTSVDDLFVYTTVTDIFNTPSFCIELRRERTIAAFGEEISRKNFIAMLILSFCILLAGLALLYFAQRRFMQEEIAYRSTHDPLTNLPNMLFFKQNFPLFLKQAQRKKAAFGFIFIDIDRFKSVNDSYGMKEGDLVLCDIASRVRKEAAADMAFRFGADKFALASIAKDKNHIEKQAIAVRSALNEPFLLTSGSMRITASIGLSFSPHHGNNANAIMHAAELAMYKAKENGGNSITVYTPGLDEEASSKKRLETALYKTIEDNAFFVNYQPKIDIRKKRVVGCEALIRWQQDGRWIPPSTFIPFAEEIGLVTKIDMFVLRTACKQIVQWQKEGIEAVPIAVNMSVKGILLNDFVEQVQSIMQEEGVPSSLIDLEITETSLITDPERAFFAIARLHDAGIRIALDDFGTGYSSLSYLSRLPISFLKVDKKFVDAIFSGREADKTLISAIFSLAENLSMLTISEGVETKDQLDFLANHGAAIIQGYLFSKPLFADACTEYLRNQKTIIEQVMGDVA